MDSLPGDEQPEQLADWAVFGSLVQMGLSAEDVRSAWYDQLPLRDPMFREVTQQAYGRGRRALLPDGSAWLFYAETDPAPRATLARLADQVRMELGAVPPSFVLFSYQPEVSSGLIHVTLQRQVPGEELFSKRFGYVAARVSSSRDLMRWLAKVDDLSHLSRVNDFGALEFGGRCFEEERTPGLRLEDVAALYQGHAEAKAASQLSGLVPPKSEPGFSLDPTTDRAGAIHGLEELLSAPDVFFMRAIKTVRAPGNQHPIDAMPIVVQDSRWLVLRALAEDEPGIDEDSRKAIQETLQALREREGSPWELLNQLEQRVEPNPFARDAVSLVLSENSFQCARYDGGLQNTRIGNTFFYGDLLAKVWASTDYYRSAPVDDIEGFQSDPRVAPSVGDEYQGEEERLPSTRIWFGPKAEGVSRTADEREINFAHIGTRVFAAGSNPLDPAEESLPAETSRRVIGWWDRNYARLAAYEPQYHLLNQGMKWSAVAGWLSDQGLMDFLRGRTVDRSTGFLSWYQQTPNLRFRKDVRFLPSERTQSKTECMELLVSYPFRFGGGLSVISGGVSGGNSRTLTDATVVPSKVTRPQGRGGLDYVHSIPGKIVRRDGAAFELGVGSHGNPLEVVVRPPASARLRAESLQLSAPQMTVRYAARPDAPLGAVHVHVGGIELGSLEVAKIAGRIQLKWLEGTLDKARAVSREINTAVEAGKYANEARASWRIASEGRYLVEGPSGVEILQRGSADSIGTRILAHAVGARRQSQSQLPLMINEATSTFPFTDAELSRRLSEMPWQRIRARPGDGLLERVFTATGPSRKARLITLPLRGRGMRSVEAYVDRQGTLYLRRPTATEAQGDFNDIIARESFTHAYVSELTKAKNLPRDGGFLPPAEFAETGRIVAAQPKQVPPPELLPTLQNSLEKLRKGELIPAVKAIEDLRPRLVSRTTDWSWLDDVLRSDGRDGLEVARYIQAEAVRPADAAFRYSLTPEGQAVYSTLVNPERMASRPVTRESLEVLGNHPEEMARTELWMSRSLQRKLGMEQVASRGETMTEVLKNPTLQFEELIEPAKSLEKVSRLQEGTERLARWEGNGAHGAQSAVRGVRHYRVTKNPARAKPADEDSSKKAMLAVFEGSSECHD
ncbi:hypothetical protein LZ198_13540 [Myxococcus sp. K15C18031901]|uniref:hypothetical protein n=1 Tax=Myxococcus dinghuensis TaxID=2906761 RepID=UPI0020A71269|nr:hypothetical protein [Myxococcus dinghuensis]MCP3099893.1 hypothetical protein [Myxococcus dinghuensis]